MKKFGVNRRVLLFTAGGVWIAAGINILRIGILTWMDTSRHWLFQVAEATVVFLLFFFLVFRRLYRKYSSRISLKNEKSCPFSFFDLKGWLMMAFMITLGILVRTFHWLPDSFISVFYAGLAVALVWTGCLFLVRGWKNRLK